MSAYFIVDIDVHNPAGMAEYLKITRVTSIAWGLILASRRVVQWLGAYSRPRADIIMVR